MSKMVEVYQPPQKGYHCKDCGAKIKCPSRNKSGLCHQCSTRRIGLQHGGRNKGKKRDDEK